MTAFPEILVALLCSALVCAAPQQPTGQEPLITPPGNTFADPQLSLPNLTSLLLPLAQQQLVVEADGWLGRVQETCQAIADREVADRAATDHAQRQALRDLAGQIMNTCTARIDRLDAVVNDLERKGGAAEKVAVHRQVARAVKERFDAAGAGGGRGSRLHAGAPPHAGRPSLDSRLPSLASERLTCRRVPPIPAAVASPGARSCKALPWPPSPLPAAKPSPQPDHPLAPTASVPGCTPSSCN